MDLTLVRGEVARALRLLRRRPAFAASAVSTMAIGVGATTAVFGIVHAVLLRPLPVYEQDRLVVIRAEDRSKSDPHIGIPNDVLWDFTARTHQLSAVAGVLAAGDAEPFTGHDGDRRIQLAVTLTTGNFFQVLGVRAALGRTLNVQDDTHRGALAVMLSHRAWEREFGGDPGIIGKTLVLQGTRQTVVGILPEGFDYPQGTDAWESDYQFLRNVGVEPGPEFGYWDLVARLRPYALAGPVSVEFRDLLREYDSPRLGPPASRAVVVTSFADVVEGDMRPSLSVLAAAVALVLLMACANVASLLLSRGLDRRTEFAIRKALGADTVSLIFQLVVENGVLGVIGGTIGVFTAALLLRAAVSLAPPGLARFSEIRLDPAFFAFAALLIVGATFLFGLPPALAMIKREPAAALRNERGARATPGGARAQQYLVVAQIAVAVVVLSTTGLLVRTLSNLRRHDLGFDPQHLLFLVLERSDNSGASTDGQAAEARHRALLEGLAARLVLTPGVRNAAATTRIPFGIVGGTNGIAQHYRLENQSTDDAFRGPTVIVDAVSAAYTRTLGIRVTDGRPLSPTDLPTSERVALVSESFARTAWPGQSALGKHFQLINEFERDAMRTVVGVVADTRYSDLTSVRPTVYVPLPQSHPGAVLVVRTRSEPLSILPTVREIMGQLDPDYAIGDAISMRELLSRALAKARFVADTLTLLSVVALSLAVVGLFGVLSLLVRQRMREIGVRMALGGTPADVRKLLVRHCMRLAGCGAVLGLLIVASTTRLLRSVLYEVSPADPLTLAVVLILVAAGSLVATLGPLVRASRIDPVRALRTE